MSFKKAGRLRAEAVGYYGTAYSDADDVLDYITSDITGVQEERSSYYDQQFKVTIIVEAV